MIVVYILLALFCALGVAACYVACVIEEEKKNRSRGGFMSWNIQKKGTPQEVSDAVKADPGAQYMPEGLALLIDDLLVQAKGPVALATNGHVLEGIGEAHLTIAAEAPKEEVPA